MSGIKGIVILTRFEYIENEFGRDVLKKINEQIDVDESSSLHQPIGISKEYSEHLLQKIDDILLKDIFAGKVERFREMGHWIAGRLMPRYFQIYLDEQNPGGFLAQMSRMRHLLIGLGEMGVSALNKRSYWLRINYGQPYSQTVRLSELGFLEEGCRMCGAGNVKTSEEKSTDTTVEYSINWEK